MTNYLEKKIGVLGGGQLGKMLCQAAHPMGIRLNIMDQSDKYPAATVTPHFVQGNFQNYQDVVNFGRDKDIVTIEIESVNTEALHYLEKNGIKVFPQPAIIDLIKDKGLQKSFYKNKKIPTSPFALYESDKEIRTSVQKGKLSIPFVQKARTGGYDGRGVFVVKSEDDLKNLLPVPSVVENLVDIDKELAVIVARNESGDVRAFPTVEMEFHPTANLVEFLFSPSKTTKKIQKEAEDLAVRIATDLEIVGILAVELFLNKEGNILINEVAPRPHNSGHHTIEANYTSQYAQHLRAILDLPLGNTEALVPAVMCNVLGEEGHEGKARYENIAQCLEMKGVHIHLYGKETTNPFRKMGHVTVIDDELDKAMLTAKKVKDSLKVISKNK